MYSNYYYYYYMTTRVLRETHARAFWRLQQWRFHYAIDEATNKTFSFIHYFFAKNNSIILRGTNVSEVTNQIEWRIKKKKKM